MAFLDNNIITLDAVLTDVGRKRLAQGNGSFVISQFGLGDDEINYGLYDVNNSSGSAYYDLNILQTPVFEAITNSTTALKHNLISLTDNPRTLFMPVLKLNTLKSGKGQYNGSYVVVSNDTFYTTLVGSTNTSALTRYTGFTDGRGATVTNPSGVPTFLIEVGQGIDNAGAQGGPSATLSADLTETQFAVYMNNLFLEPIDINGTSATSIIANTQGALTVTQTGIFNTVDNTAVYMFTNTTAPNYFASAPVINLSPFAGPQGPSLQFGLKASTTLLNNLSYYFTKYGSSQTINFGSAVTVKVISTSVKVKGMSLGYELSIPVQLIAQF